MVGLYEGRRTNVLKVQLRLKGVVGLHEGRGANSLKVHQQLRLVGLRDMNGRNDRHQVKSLGRQNMLILGPAKGRHVEQNQF